MLHWFYRGRQNQSQCALKWHSLASLFLSQTVVFDRHWPLECPVTLQLFRCAPKWYSLASLLLPLLTVPDSRSVRRLCSYCVHWSQWNSLASLVPSQMVIFDRYSRSVRWLCSYCVPHWSDTPWRHCCFRRLCYLTGSDRSVLPVQIGSSWAVGYRMVVTRRRATAVLRQWQQPLVKKVCHWTAVLLLDPFT